MIIFLACMTTVPLALQPLLLLVNLTGLKNPHQMSWGRACSSAGAFDLGISLVLASSSTVVERVSDEEMVVGDTDDVPGPQKKKTGESDEGPAGSDRRKPVSLRARASRRAGATVSVRILIVKQNENVILIASGRILQFVPARAHIFSRAQLVGLTIGKENPVAHVATTQSEHSTNHLGSFGQYFTEEKALAKPTSKESRL